MAAKPGKSTDILDAVALLVIDMQGPFLDVIEGAPAVIERCGFAIEAARTLGLRIIFTEQVPAKLGPTEPRLRALAPNARTFAKNTFSALQAEGLLDYLRRHSVYHLLVVGIEIPVCIYQTSLHAVDSDFDVTILSDCVTGRRMEDCLVTLEALTRAHCHVLPAEAVFYSMLGHSGHPLFSVFNTLVKRYAQAGGLDAAPPPPASRDQQAPTERRPALAAPEDRPDAPDADDVAAGDGSGESESEPYIGRDADSAPAAEGSDADESQAHDDDSAPDEESREGDESEDTADGENDEGDRSDDGRDGPGQAGDGQSGEGGPGGRRRRGRRRRGGARRRRARERAAATGGGPGHAAGGGGDRHRDAPPGLPAGEAVSSAPTPEPASHPPAEATPPPLPRDERPPE